MGDILQAILDNLLTVAPWFFVKMPEGGVIFRKGRNPRVVGAGIHPRIPFVDHIEMYSMVIAYLVTTVQTVTTKDEQAICFSLRIGYVVNDPIKHYCNVTDFDEGVEAVAQLEAAARIAALNYADIRSEDEDSADLKSLLRSLRRTISNRANDWGAKVVELGFNDWAHVPLQVRLFGVKEE